MNDRITYQGSIDNTQHHKHVLIIAVGFFVLAQLLFLDGMTVRIVFTLAFALFFGLYFVISMRQARKPIPPLQFDPDGIHFKPFKKRHGSDHIPWSEIERMKIANTFGEGHVLRYFLCLRLREGRYRNGLKLSATRHLGLGLDLNIPLDYDTPVDEILGDANRFWKHYGQ